ncbi:hypothetical protein B0H34DRAFT_736254 [Crassisporium funariophilum]|nr:hypothetical protein B0H34DRAFT_736254 [Crassisporium funariophilum]
MSLELLSKREYIHKMNKITPDCTIIGLNRGIDNRIPKDDAGCSPLVTLEIKSVRIVEKVYEEKYLRSSEFTGNNKDDFMTKTAARGRTLQDAEDELRRNKFGKNSWADDTLEVLAQVL